MTSEEAKEFLEKSFHIRLPEPPESKKIKLDNVDIDCKKINIMLNGKTYTERDIEVLEIIRKHKLLNYVLKNKKCADMYKLTDDEINLLKEWLDNEKI